MDDRNVGYAQGIGSSDIGAFADNLAESLDRQMKIAFEPEERKSLRRFSSTEVASLLRVSTSNLRNRHKDGSFPGAVRLMRTRIGLLRIAGTYAEQSWRHSVRAALRLSLKLSRE